MDTFASVIQTIAADNAPNPEAYALLKARAEVTRAQAELRRAQERYADVHGAHNVGDTVMFNGGLCTVGQSWAELTPLGTLKIAYVLHPIIEEDMRFIVEEKEISKSEEKP